MKRLVIPVLALSLMACSGTRPVQLGGEKTALLPCPDKPNCVSSLANPDDRHYVPPIQVSNTAETIARIAKVITTMPNAELIVESTTYLYAEYTSDLIGFVDDVEFLANPGTNRIDMRSASRLGYSDFDVNRKRVEAIRSQITP